MLAQYPQAVAATLVPCAAAGGGYSGAELWKLSAVQGELCLRAWPPGAVDPDRLAWIHHQLSRIAGAGCALVPSPLPTRTGATYVAYEGRWWELSAWLPGAAHSGRDLTGARLVAAMRALAHFHQIALEVMSHRPAPGVSPSLARRRRLAEELRQGLWQHLDHAVRTRAPADLAPRARAILDHYRQRAPDVLREVCAAEQWSVPQQVCHGDLWHDHVLFRDERVTGLVDFGAMRVDSRAVDIARLLGSLAICDPATWQAGVAAYEQAAPLADAERALVPVLDRSAILLGGMNWLKWLLLEGRSFRARERVLRRLDAIIARLTIAGHDR